MLAAGCTNTQTQETTTPPVDQSKVNVELEQSLQKIDDSAVTVKEDQMVVLKTNQGDIKIKFYTKDAPKTVENFLKLAKANFYDGVKFHRVIKDFMIQTGDPNSKDNDWSDDGMGGPGYTFADEINSHKLVLGSVAMANSGPNTNGSQFFIVTAESTPWLDGLHTNFGEVVEGMDVVKKIEAIQTGVNDHPKTDMIIEDVEIVE